MKKLLLTSSSTTSLRNKPAAGYSVYHRSTSRRYWAPLETGKSDDVCLLVLGVHHKPGIDSLYTCVLYMVYTSSL
jgi:hypothetical protein